MTVPYVIGASSGNRPVLSTVLIFLFAFLFVGPSAAQAPAASQPGSQSGLRLVGTVESGPFSGAVLDDGTGVQTFYGLHDTLPDGSKIIKVKNDSILLKQPDGAVYELFIAQNTNAALRTPPPAVSEPPSQVENVPDGGRGRQTAPRKHRSGIPRED